MARAVFAPWGEIVPGAGPMTADELLHMPNTNLGCEELVRGVLIRSPYHTCVQGRLIADLIGAFGPLHNDRDRGEFVANAGFLLSKPDEPDTVLAPDISFVRAANVPPRDSPDIAGYLRLAPDLAVEVASPDQYKPEMGAKARLYLEAGVRLVWVVWPGTRTVDVWRPGGDAPVATLTINDSLDGLDVLPGFSYPLADLLS
jgi:Uma2 family endonuclease